MKKIISIATFIVILSAGAEAKNAAGKFLISPFGGIGMALAGGDYPDRNSGDDKDPALDVGLAYNGGIMFGYAPISAGAVTFGFEYASKPFVFHHHHQYDGKYTITRFNHFIDLLVGWRGYVKYFYYEAGLFWGFKILKWKYVVDDDGYDLHAPYDHKYDIDEVNADHDFGVYFGLGASIPLASFVSLDLGIKIEAAIVAAYETPGIKLTTLPILFQAGFTFFI